jgi:uncharacterized damage-inducible protein DinB
MASSSSEALRIAELATAIRESSVKRFRAVPHGFENWRPSPGAMSIADLAQHLVDADEWLFEKLRNCHIKGIKGTSGLKTVANRDEFETLIGRLSELSAQRSRMIAGLSDEALAREVDDDRFGDEVSIWWVIVRGNLDHESHHRGQLAAYLRLVNSLNRV